MDTETIKWVAGLLILPLVLFTFVVISLLRDIKKTTDQLLVMHQNSDKYGFGTGQLGECMAQMSDAFQDQSYYMKWMVTEMTGKKPPPPVHTPSSK